MALCYKWYRRVIKKLQISPRIWSQIWKALRYRVRAWEEPIPKQIKGKKSRWTVPLILTSCELTALLSSCCSRTKRTGPNSYTSPLCTPSAVVAKPNLSYHVSLYTNPSDTISWVAKSSISYYLLSPSDTQPAEVAKPNLNCHVALSTSPFDAQSAEAAKPTLAAMCHCMYTSHSDTLSAEVTKRNNRS